MEGFIQRDNYLLPSWSMFYASHAKHVDQNKTVNKMAMKGMRAIPRGGGTRRLFVAGVHKILEQILNNKRLSLSPRGMF